MSWAKQAILHAGHMHVTDMANENEKLLVSLRSLESRFEYLQYLHDLTLLHSEQPKL